MKLLWNLNFFDVGPWEGRQNRVLHVALDQFRIWFTKNSSQTIAKRFLGMEDSYPSGIRHGYL